MAMSCSALRHLLSSLVRSVETYFDWSSGLSGATNLIKYIRSSSPFLGDLHMSDKVSYNS